jgi:hypothetical protein
MKWFILIGAGILGLAWLFRDDVLAGVWALVFVIAAASLWKDNDAV